MVFDGLGLVLKSDFEAVKEEIDQKAMVEKCKFKYVFKESKKDSQLVDCRRFRHGVWSIVL